jgi:hypothetical protein
MSTGPFPAPGEVKRVLVRDEVFHKGFQDAVRTLPGYTSMGIALVDLTNATIRYAATPQEHLDKHVFSVAKLAPFLAAFRLRKQLRTQFGGDPARTADELIARIEKAWKPLIAARVGGRVAKPDFPNLRKIFDLDPPTPGAWKFDFRGDHMGHDAGREKLVWKYLDALNDRHNGYLPTDEVDLLPFMHRLKLSVRMSDDMSAGSVASDVGLAYMFGVMVSEGLYNEKGRHGLWLSNTYGYDAKFSGFEGSGVQMTAGATAYSVAEYLTRLHLKTLVDRESSERMLDILKERSGRGIGTLSRFNRLANSRVTHSKIGLWRPTGNTSEGAIVESTGRTADGREKTVRYVAVGLQDLGGARMLSLVRSMDAYVKRVNGLT